MSADWFCKIDGKKIGPLNAQQLKTAVAKGQIKPEHLVRRGEEGPWLPAGRIKGLFPASSSKPAGGNQPIKAAPLPTAKPTVSAASPPAAVAAAVPPNQDVPKSEMPDEFSLGGGHGHSAFSVDQFEISVPTPKSNRRKSKGTNAAKKSQQQKVANILMIVIGVCFTVALVALGYAFASGQFASHDVEKKEDPAASAAAVAAASKKAEEEKKLAADSEWEKITSVKSTIYGKVQFQVGLPKLQPPPAGSNIDAEKYPEVVVLPINLKLKDGVKEPVALTSWADSSIKQDVYLKDNGGSAKKYQLLAMVPSGASSDVKTITPQSLSLLLVFEPPTEKHGDLRLELPTSAFKESGMIKLEIVKDQFPASASKKQVAKKKSDEAVAGVKTNEANLGDDKSLFEAKPTEAKPTEAKPTEAKPTEAKPAEVKPSDAKPAEAIPDSKKDDGDIQLIDPDAKK